MSIVDRSFCPSRCLERGICVLIDGIFRCLCDEPDDNCSGSSTPAVVPTSPSGSFCLPVVVTVVAVVACVFAVFVWLVFRCCRQNRSDGVVIRAIRCIPLDFDALRESSAPREEVISKC
ncbi:hypothetical protein Aduo_011437 [Ancylostoma duodenale]